MELPSELTKTTLATMRALHAAYVARDDLTTARLQIELQTLKQQLAHDKGFKKYMRLRHANSVDGALYMLTHVFA